MFKIRILSVGKTKESWLDSAITEYTKRLSPIASIDFIWAKDDMHLITLAEKETQIVCLDPTGKQLDSTQFAHFLQNRLEAGKMHLAFIIGGAEGLPSALKSRHPLISLSLLTFTHQITRLILVEQIYRSFEILKGSPYHK